MKRFLRTCTIVNLTIIVLLLSACQVEKMEEPRINVTAKGQEIKVLHCGNIYNGSQDIEKLMLEAKGDNSWEEVPYIELGQDIIIETSNFTTEQLIVSNYILGENGEILNDKKTWETKSIPVSHGKATIPLD